MNNLLKLTASCGLLSKSALIKPELLLNPSALSCPNLILYRNIAKHWNPKFKKLRGLKVIKVKLPDFEKLNKPIEDLSKEELKSRMKEMGVLPARNWIEKPMYISSTGGVFEAYVPPEGDGKVSLVKAQGAKQKIEFIEKKTKSMLALRKIRNFEEEFEFSNFLNEAQVIYINSYMAMINKDRDKLIQYITERAYPEVVHNIGDKTIQWEFLESIEPPRVVHVRCTDVISEDNIFSQITVRFHSKQKLMIFDRFGRLMHGNETLPKDVLEYVVFEKHLSNKYGKWRVHAKIIPDWMPPNEPIKRTHALRQEPEADSVPVPVEETSTNSIALQTAQQ